MKRQAEILKNNEQQFRKLLLYPDELRRQQQKTISSGAKNQA